MTAFVLTVELKMPQGWEGDFGIEYPGDELEQALELCDNLANATADLLRLHPQIEEVSVEYVDT